MRWSMRRLFLILIALIILASGPARGQNVVQEFSGTGETTTAMFTVGDQWEVRWNARQAVSVAALSSNGTLVAGASGVLRGSLFVPAGGQYYLKITDGTVAPPPPAPAPAPSTNAAPLPGTNSVPEPVSIVPEADAPAAPTVSWHLQVLQLAQAVASTDSLTVYTPYFTVPNSAITTPTTPPPPPPVLTPDQINTLVTIKGDRLQGSGFLLRTTDGVHVVAHLRLLAENPNLIITTQSGTVLKILSMKAAVNRNLVLIAVQDDHLKCLSEPAGKDTPAALGDYVIIPVLGQTDLTAAKVGRIINLSPERIDFDAPVDIASNSAPIIHVASGKVLGIVTAQKAVNLTQTTAKAWSENPVPGAETIVPYFGLSLVNATAWEPLDLAIFDRENHMLQDFHNRTRCLDAYLNGPRRPGSAPAASLNGPPDSRSYKSDVQLQAASDNFRKQAIGADSDQALDATRELLDDLQSVAKIGVDQLQAMNPTYAINRRRVQEELAYRQALQDELNAFGDNIQHLDSIAQTR